MTLGILVTTSRHLDDIIGITRAAVSKGHEVEMFVMDEGVRLLDETALLELVTLEGVAMSFCEASTNQLGFVPEGIPKEIISGSQFNNAMMIRSADRVISL